MLSLDNMTDMQPHPHHHGHGQCDHAREHSLHAAEGLARAETLTRLRPSDPEGVLGPIAAKAVGRSGALAVRAQTTGWVEAALAATVTLTVLLLLSLWSAHRWGATSRTYDADDDTVAGARGERVRSDWDALSSGHDPTDVPDAPRT